MHESPNTIPEETPPLNSNVKPASISFEEASVSERYDDIFQTITPSAIAIVRWREGSYEFVCTNGVSLRVQVPASGIVRLRYAPDGNFGPDFSYGLDPAFEAEKITITSTKTTASTCWNLNCCKWSFQKSTCG